MFFFEPCLFTAGLRKSCNLLISMPSILDMMSVDDFNYPSTTLFSSHLSLYSPVLTRNTLISTTLENMSGVFCSLLHAMASELDSIKRSTIWVWLFADAIWISNQLVLVWVIISPPLFICCLGIGATLEQYLSLATSIWPLQDATNRGVCRYAIAST